MTTWVAGMRITAARMNDYTPTTATTGCTAAANFAVSSFDVRSVAGSCSWNLILTYSGGTLTGSAAGNIADTAAGTLDAAYRPDSQAVVTWDKGGAACGAARVTSAGVITLTTLDPTATLASGDTVNLSGSYIVGT